MMAGWSGQPAESNGTGLRDWAKGQAAEAPAIPSESLDVIVESFGGAR